MLKVLAYVAIAAALFMAGFGYGAYQTSAKVSEAALKTQKQVYDQVRAADQRTFDAALKVAKDAMTIDAQTGDRLSTLERNSRSTLEAIRNAPRSIACINSPVVRAYVERMRQRQPAASPASVAGTPPD